MDSMPVCPAPMTMPFVRSLDRMMSQMGSDYGCECVPMVLMQMVMTQQEVMGRSLDRANVDSFTGERVKVGKKTCTCDFTFTVAGNGKAKGTGSCDKKCSGNVKEMTLNSATYSYTFGFGVKKGKVKVGKIEAVGGSVGGTTSMPGGSNARRIRDARRRIRPLRMCLRPRSQRHGDWVRIWIRIRVWRVWIWCHTTSSHWWQWNRRLHLWYCQEVDKDRRRCGDRGQRVAMAGWYGLER